MNVDVRIFVPQNALSLRSDLRTQWIHTVGSVLTDTSINNPRPYTQIHTPIVVQGGGGSGGWIEPLSGVFDMLQYSKTILPSSGKHLILLTR